MFYFFFFELFHRNNDRRFLSTPFSKTDDTGMNFEQLHNYFL